MATAACSASSTSTASDKPRSLWSVRRDKTHAAKCSFQKEIAKRLDRFETMLEQVLSGLALLLPEPMTEFKRLELSTPPGLNMSEDVLFYDIGDHRVDMCTQTEALPQDIQVSCIEHYEIRELHTDAIVQTDIWEPVLDKRGLDADVQTTGDWKPLCEYQTKCCGPELGTLDEVDLLPPLLGRTFVTGQLVWTNIVSRLEADELMSPSSMGRILRQHECSPS